MNMIESFNRTMYLYTNGSDTAPLWLVDIAKIVGVWTIYLLPILLLSLLFSKSPDYRLLAIKAGLVVLLALFINQAIGFFWPCPRPFMLGLGRTWLHHAPTSSFPSNHATIFFSIGLTLFLGRATWLACIILITGVAVAWARVFLGVHFPLDMLGAVVVTVVSYVIITPIWRNIDGHIRKIAEIITVSLKSSLSQKAVNKTDK